MRTPYDQFGKQLLRAALEPRGTVETDAEVHVDTRRIDLWFRPSSSHTTRMDPLGLLGRITNHPSTLELFHNTPGGDELASCLIKHGEFRHFLSLRESPLPIPTQWVISSGRPHSGIDGLWLRPMSTWPRGCYEGPPLLWTRLVVVNELPVDRDTLLLRLLGAGASLKRAIAELGSLPPDARERALAQPILLRLRLAMPRDPMKQTTDDQEFLMDTQDIVENWHREAMEEGLQRGREEGVQRGREEGVQRGREEGVQQGREEGLKQGVAAGLSRLLINTCASRFGALPDDVVEVIYQTDDEAKLGSWIQLACTQEAHDIVAAIRAARPN